MQNCEYTLRTIAVGSEDRTFVGGTLHGAGRAADKLRMSAGRGKDAQSVLAKALSKRAHPIRYLHTLTIRLYTVLRNVL